MNETSRRSFIAAGAGAAAGTVALSADAAAAATRVESRTGKPARESVVAWVPDHTSDALHLMVGEREVVVRDRALVSQLLAAAGGK